MIDDHDYDVKMRSMQRFFEEGDKVKVTLRFRGREMAHQELGTKLLNRVKDDTVEDRQGRDGAALRRPPDGDGAGAAVAAVRRRSRPLREAIRPGLCITIIRNVMPRDLSGRAARSVRCRDP